MDGALSQAALHERNTAPPRAGLFSLNAMNVDTAELEKFSALAEQWWDPAGPMRALHAINPVRTAWVDQHARLQGKRVLDVGCGAGLLTESMARLGAQVTGIDLASASLQVAREHAREAGLAIEYVESSVEALAQRGAGAFEVVTCMELLEHVPDPAQVVSACAQLTTPGGWCFFSTINRNAKAFALAIVGAEYALGLVPRGTHEYARLIRPSELVRSARNAGLELVELKGLRFNPFNQNVTLCDDTDVNYLVACRKPETMLG